MPAPSDSTSQGAPRYREGETSLRRLVVNALSGYPDVFVRVNEANVFKKVTDMLPSRWKQAAYQLVLPEERYGLGIGSPDLLVVVRGVALFLELKTEDGRVKTGQHEWHAIARSKGVRVEVVRSVEEARQAVERVRGGVTVGASEYEVLR